MNKIKNIDQLSLSNILERKISFVMNNDIFPKGDNCPHDAGSLKALQNMLKDSHKMIEEDFQLKYFNEIKLLKINNDEKPYSGEYEDDYDEAYNNQIVEILTIVNPINQYDLDES